MDLSQPFGCSVSDYIQKDKYSLKYVGVDDACTKREILSLIGKLSFVTKCIPASRIFLRRMIELSCKVDRLHYKIALTDGFRRDIAWWREFLPLWNGTTGFVHPQWEPASTLHLYTDAAGSIAQCNFVIKITHIAGVINNIADALSRFQTQRFRELHPTADGNGTTPPDLLARLRPFLTGEEPPIPLSAPVTSLQPEWHLLPGELMLMESAVSSYSAE
ncbi:uncharacterized protein LOC129592615 [Paramacrobiotus metropolitanus]|uniref:uncharacterized protein LOC129592615 n=1 Tax=Paramacrobiotus metropolitanus TaxID=2943436 RepID=UPI002445CC05|nr:uncharacterized protein LOC129592615 [Paramacrobiotus metropolitanus]